MEHFWFQLIRSHYILFQESILFEAETMVFVLIAIIRLVRSHYQLLFLLISIKICFWLNNGN